MLMSDQAVSARRGSVSAIPQVADLHARKVAHWKLTHSSDVVIVRITLFSKAREDLGYICVFCDQSCETENL